MEIPAEKFPLLKKYLSWQLMLKKNLLVCLEKESCHQGFGKTNSYPNQITHTPTPATSPSKVKWSTPYLKNVQEESHSTSEQGLE